MVKAESLSHKGVSRRDFLKAAALLAGAAAVETHQILGNIKNFLNFAEIISPFALSPLPENYAEKTTVKTSLPKELWGTSLNAFGAWECEKKDWDELLDLMKTTGTNSLRISTLWNDPFEKEEVTQEKIGKMDEFLKLIDKKNEEIAANNRFVKSVNNDAIEQREITIMCDIFDGFAIFNDGTFNGSFPAQGCRTDGEVDEQHEQRLNFFDKEVMRVFMNKVDTYLKGIGHHKCIKTWTIANELNEPDTEDGIEVLNQWYFDIISHIRNFETRPLIFGLVKPNEIDDTRFLNFGQLIHSIHWYPNMYEPGMVLFPGEMIQNSLFPVIIQEGGFPAYAMAQAYVPRCWEESPNKLKRYLYKNLAGMEIPLPDDMATASLYTELIKKGTWNDELHVGHVSWWGAWPHHKDGFEIVPDEQPRTLELMLMLSEMLSPIPVEEGTIFDMNAHKKVPVYVGV